jgi:Asp-tRNA(Asn)/Glu-tRNA(Gln) amidotransferase A subunit family amidase
VTPEIRAAVRTAAEALRRAGFQVEPFRPEGLEEARTLWKKFFVKCAGMLIRPMFHKREPDLSPILRQFLEWSDAEPELTGESLLDAWIRRDAARGEFLAQMQKYPILLCPPAAVPAFRHGERSWQIAGKTIDYLDAWSYTSTCSAIRPPSCLLVTRRKVCQSVCRSSEDRGRKRKCSKWRPSSNANVMPGGNRLLTTRTIGIIAE